MVIIVRHGITQIEPKPCRKEERDINQEDTEDTIQDDCHQDALTPSSGAVAELRSDLDCYPRARFSQQRAIQINNTLSDSVKLTSSVTSQNDPDRSSVGPGYDSIRISKQRISLADHHNTYSLDGEKNITHTSESNKPPVTSSVSSSSSRNRTGNTGSYSLFFGCKQWKFFILYVILSMCLIFEGCSCLLCPSSDPNSVPWYLRINDTQVGVSTGLCLTMTGSVSGEICSSNKRVPGNGREKKLRNSKFNTKFCGLPLYSIISSSERKIVMDGDKSACAAVLQQVEDLDNELRELYISFSDVVDRMDCRRADSYSVKWNCEACREAYKRWLCSVYVNYYFGDQDEYIIKPCVDFCDHVTQRCPFFRLFGDGLIGEPGFICKDNNIHPKTRAAAMYGRPGCCYKPCHIYEYTVTSDRYKPCSLNITSNCTAYHAALANSAASSTSSFLMTSSTLTSTPHRLRNISPYLFIVLSVTMSFMLQTGVVYSCIDLT